MALFIELVKLPSNDELKEIIILKSKSALSFWNERPLWVKLSVVTTAVSYGYLRYKWTALNGSGFDVLSPSIFSFGTAGHYAADNGLPDFGKEELIDKNRKTVAYYRLADPIIFTIDVDLIKPIFTTHFGSFPTRMPSEGMSLGLGHDMALTLDQIDNVHQWKRLRSSMSPGFSTRQLGEMLIHTNTSLDILTEQIRGLNGESIDSRIIGGKFAIDAFLTSALSVDMNKELENIREFENHPIVKHFLSILNGVGSPWIALTLLIPGLGNIFDYFGRPIVAGDAIRWFRSFCKALLNQRTVGTEGSGRSKDFLNIFASNQISNAEGKTATKGFTHDEMIGSVFVLLGAGYETTATTLNWTFYQIAKDQQLQDQLREEALQIDVTNTANITPEKMPWICATISETLRLRSPVGLNFRRCVNDVNINGRWFNKGYNVEIPTDTLHTCTDYWGDDAGEFAPKRFVDNPELEKEWFYLPFGGGPRNCIGQRFALLQARLALTRILQSFKVELPEGFVDDVQCVRLNTTFVKSSKKLLVTFTPFES